MKIKFAALNVGDRFRWFRGGELGDEFLWKKVEPFFGGTTGTVRQNSLRVDKDDGAGQWLDDYYAVEKVD
jgi:hypothetical protein